MKWVISDALVPANLASLEFYYQESLPDPIATFAVLRSSGLKMIRSG